MTFKQSGQKFIVKLNKGEEVVETLTQFSKNQSINSGIVSAIGGVSSATLGWYELATKSYHWQDFSGNLEVVSLTGNISMLDHQPFLHVHTVVSNESFQCFGGHLKQAVIGVTLEVIIEKSDQIIERKMDDEIGLNLLKLDS